MNESLNWFLNELETTEGDKVVKSEREVFETALDESRWKFIKEAKKQIDFIVNKDGGVNKHGRPKNAWAEQGLDGRWKITFKCDSTVLELVEGKTFYMLPDEEAACKFIAKAAIAAEERHLDQYLVIEKKQKKASQAGKILQQFRKERVRADQIEAYQAAAQPV